MTDITDPLAAPEEVLALGDKQVLIDQIAGLREEAKADHHLDLPVPGYDKLLWARFRPFPSAKTEKKAAELRKAAQRGEPIMLSASMDTIIDACEQIMVLKPEFAGDKGLDGANLIPIDDEVPIKFDTRLAELLKFGDGIKTARDVLLGLYPTEQSILGQSVTIAQWLQDTSRKTDEELLGE